MKTPPFFLLPIILGCSSSHFARIDENVYPPLDSGKPVVVITSYEEPPQEAMEIGTFSHTEGAFGNGLWLNLKPKVTALARNSGANIVQIHSYSPVGMATSGSVTGKFFRIQSDSLLNIYSNSAVFKSANDCRCAIVHILRYEGISFRSAFPIQAFLNGSFVADIPDNSDHIIRVPESGRISFSPYPDRGGITLDVKVGNEYFLIATQSMSSSGLGIAVGSQVFQPLDPDEGRLWAFMIRSKK